MGQAVPLGPVAGIEANIIHLAPPASRADDYEYQLLRQLAGHSAALADLMQLLASEVATLNGQQDLAGRFDSVVGPTRRFGLLLEGISVSLEGRAACEMAKQP